VRAALGHIRAAARLGLLCALTATLYGAWAIAVAFIRSKAARRGWRYAASRAWAKGVARIAGMNVSASGAPPSPPFLLVANHLSYIDVVALSSLVGCVYVARGDVARWPLIGRLCRGMEVVFVDRTRRGDVRRANETLARALADGEGVVLFAEGTSTAGASVAHFKPSLLEPAVRARLPVHYASLSYRTPAGAPPAHLAVCWWGDMTFLRHLYGLFKLPAFEASVVFGPAPVGACDRKALAADLRRAVSRQFVPVTPLEEECAHTI
jgi:1-acyl-sn-glycerol-3-phosphate acyltransferase